MPAHLNVKGAERSEPDWLWKVLILGSGYIAFSRGAQIASSQFDGEIFLRGAGFILLETKALAKTVLPASAAWALNTFVIGASPAMIPAGDYRSDERLVYEPGMGVRWAIRFHDAGLITGATTFFASIVFADCYESVPGASDRSGKSLFRAIFETVRAWRNRQTHRT